MGSLRTTLRLLAERLPLSPVRHAAQTILRKSPWHVGYESLVFSAPFALLTHGQPRQFVQMRDGQRILVCPSEHIGLLLMWTGDLDPRISTVLPKVLRPGDRVLDVGANVGWFTLLASKLVGSGGLVRAFEPQNDAVIMLQASLLANERRNVEVYPFGLSKESKVLSLFVSPHNHGLASLDAKRVPNGVATTVQLRAFGELPSAVRTDDYRMLKLDAEGHEAVILEAMKDLLSTRPPSSVLFESNADARPLLDRPTFKILQRHGYEIFALGGTAFSTQLADLRSFDPGARATPTDFLGWHRSQPWPDSLPRP